MNSSKRPLRFLVTGALLAGGATACEEDVAVNEPMPMVNEEPPVEEPTNNEVVEPPEPVRTNEVEPPPEPEPQPEETNTPAPEIQVNPAAPE